jgi:lipopolysaccharide biosynthesis regulator YciM
MERAAGRLEQARQYLREVRGAGRRLPRGALLRADVAIEQGDLTLARRLLTNAIEQDPGQIDEALPRVVRIARSVADGGAAAVAEFVAACSAGSRELAYAAIVSDTLDFPALQKLVRDFLRDDESVAGLIRALGRDVDELDARALGEVCGVLRRLAASMPRHRCIDCGFTSRAHFWQCPACKTWDSQRPVLRFEFGFGHEAAARHA